MDPLGLLPPALIRIQLRISDCDQTDLLEEMQLSRSAKDLPVLGFRV